MLRSKHKGNANDVWMIDDEQTREDITGILPRV